ncbi:MAG: hypothetical protein KC635_00925 [Myxococcales bacterium]|nr:hypothetical protein [Myxococcales bacterium]MCB9735298.1 hypothetical protein [Deltaproteobacteria bacterium]
MIVPAQIADGLWEARYETPMMGARMPCRATVARGADGALVLYGAPPLDDAVAAAIGALGPVAAIVAPNTFHHLHLADAARRWPGARLVGPPGLARKRPDLSFDAVADAPAAPLGDGLEVAAILAGPKLHELAVFHRPSRSLLVADLVFNVAEPVTRLTGLILRTTGVRRGLACSRLWRAWTKDRAAHDAAIARIAEWPFTRVVPAHGAVLEADDAPARLLAAIAKRMGPVAGVAP